MSLAPGTRLGPFEVVSSLGAGGMGEVYRARDSRLDRDVALKILPEVFAADPDRLMRFEREAKTLASLNHPHIAQIHGIEESSGIRALVMELVDGQDLSRRIAGGALPIDEALQIAWQVAGALAAAHDAGIIHRDLKPANIKVRHDGTVKVLDFGLAKAAVAAPGVSAGAAAASPTFTSPALTQLGVIIGTVAYMAPEQAKGRTVDRAADLWAFGAVLFEMLSGRRAFPGDDITDTLATVLKFDPDWTALPNETPVSIRRLLRRCLQKDPALRLRDAGTAALEIREALTGAGDEPRVPAPAAPASGRRNWLFAGALVLLTMTVTGFAAVTWLRPDETTLPVTRLVVPVASTDTLPRAAGGVLAISPDGRTFAYTVLRNRRRLILRRSLDTFEGTPIAGTELGRDPFFSPDGQWIGFTHDTVLKKVRLTGGEVSTISDLPSNTRGADWLPDGRILVGLNGPDGLVEVPAAGGRVTTVYTPEKGRIWHPQALGDGRTVLFTHIHPPGRDPVVGGASAMVSDLRLLDRQTGEVRPLLENALAGRLLTDGTLIFVRDEALWAVRVDMAALRTLGTPVRVVQRVRVESAYASQLAVAQDGTLVYLAGSVAGASQKRLLWLNRSEQQQMLAPPARDYVGVRLSPDGTRAAVEIRDEQGIDVWVADLALGSLTRISTSGSGEHPIWSPDGRSLVFSSRTGTDGGRHLLVRAADGTGTVAVAATFDSAVTRAQPTAWLPGDVLVVEIETRADEGDIGVVSLSGDRTWRPVVSTSHFEGQSSLSPDERWLTYGSDESGEMQVYVQPFPGPGPRQQVPGPGWMPVWSRNGRELLYLRGGPPTDVMGAQVHADAGASLLRVGPPESLAAYLFYERRTTMRLFDAPASGDRLIFITRSDEVADDERHLRVVLNWRDELRRLLSDQR